MIYSYRLGGDGCQGTKNLVPSSETYLCSMQGHTCRIATLRGKSPPGKIGNQVAKIWLCMARHERSSSYMAETQSHGSRHKAQEGRKGS